MSSWTGFGSACTDPMPCVSPDRGQSPVGNVGGAGSREPLQGLDGVCRRVSRGSARSLAHGAVRVPQTGCGDGAICSVVVHTRLFDGAKVVFFCSNSERDGAVCVLADTLVFVGGSARRCALPIQRSLARFALFCETRRQILTIHKNNCKIETHILLIDSPIRNFGKHLTNAVLCCIFADKKSSTSKRN